MVTSSNPRVRGARGRTLLLFDADPEGAPALVKDIGRVTVLRRRTRASSSLAAVEDRCSPTLRRHGCLRLLEG